MNGPVALALRLAAAHHPLCTAFRSDVVRLGRLHVCGGCLATWPAFIAALPLAWLARTQGVPAWPLAAAGLALGLPHLASYAVRAPVPVRRAAKAVGGAGLALLVVGAATSGTGLPGLVALVLAGCAASLALQAVRLRAMLRTCAACPHRRDWGSCPGMDVTGLARPLPGGPRPLRDGS
jgi:hypothetical protein